MAQAPLKQRLPPGVDAEGLERRKLAGKQPTFAERLFLIAGEAFVFGPIKDFLGMSRMRQAYTGGEPLGEDTFLFYRALGVNLKQFFNCRISMMGCSGEGCGGCAGVPRLA